eukprot:m.199177 g.199177  ORF g.199177 m.199177 type:complete len:181 (-) comp20669_c0_seq1:201-743(-)
MSDRDKDRRTALRLTRARTHQSSADTATATTTSVAVVEALRGSNTQARPGTFRAQPIEYKNCARFIARLDWVPACGATQPVVSDDGVALLSRLATVVCEDVILAAVSRAKVAAAKPRGASKSAPSHSRKAAGQHLSITKSHVDDAIASLGLAVYASAITETPAAPIDDNGRQALNGTFCA